jgi:hypothetical protein
MAVASALAGPAAADASKSYCSKGGTFTTSDPGIQSAMDQAVAVGGFWNVEFDGSTFGVNEPGETVADLWGHSDGTDDVGPLFSNPTGLNTQGGPVPASAVEFIPVFAGPCVTPPAPPPGASHVFLCNTAYPSDANMILAAVSPEGLPQQNGSADNPAADAVATGQWFYPFETGPKSLTCFMPAGAHLTGMTADLQGNALPTDVVNSLHSHGDARTMVYPQVSG